MEDFFAGLVVGILVALFTGFFAYAAAQDTVRDQAIAAGVACWKVNLDGGEKRFTWHCK